MFIYEFLFLQYNWSPSLTFISHSQTAYHVLSNFLLICFFWLVRSFCTFNVRGLCWLIKWKHFPSLSSSLIQNVWRKFEVWYSLIYHSFSNSLCIYVLRKKFLFPGHQQPELFSWLYFFTWSLFCIPN